MDKIINYITYTKTGAYCAQKNLKLFIIGNQ